MFSKQIGRNMEVYVDDMLVKSKDVESHLDNLKETFETIPYEIEPIKVCVWSFFGKVPQLHGVIVMNRSQFDESESHTRQDLT